MKKLFWIYLAIAGVFWIYLSFWGAKAYKGFAYNLGGALFWPAVIFPEVGKAIATIVVLLVVGYLTFIKRRDY